MIQDSGVTISGLGVQGLGCRIWSRGFEVQDPGSGCRVQGPGVALEGSEFEQISGAVALAFSTNKRLPAGIARGFTCQSEIRFCGVPRLERPLRRRASTLWAL
jgi:hypothetical protein